MSQFMCWFLLTVFGPLYSYKISIERGKSVILFRNVGNKDNKIALYINGKKKNTLIVTWIIMNTTITANWMPDVMANYSKIFMDSVRNIQIADADESYEGKYSIFNFTGPEVELIILPCGPNKYGSQCDHTCQCIENKTVHCDSQTGHCLCKPGWQGITCNEPCPFSYYGKNCSKACTCYNGNCSHITGQCECKIGYKGERCEDRCDEGTFGLNCQGKCNCQTGSSCEPHNGNCIYTSGNSHQLESDKVTDHPVIIGLLSAILSVIIIYIFIKNKHAIRKNLRKCCKMQENREHVPQNPIEVEDGNGFQTEQPSDSSTMKQTGGTNPVFPREQGASMNIPGRTDPDLPRGANPHSPRLPPTDMNIPGKTDPLLLLLLAAHKNKSENEDDFFPTEQRIKKIDIRKT